MDGAIEGWTTRRSVLNFAPSLKPSGADMDSPPHCFAQILELVILDKKKITVVVYPDEDGGYTAVMPYFSCHLITQGDCLAAQGETPDEAMAEAGKLLEGYLSRGGAEGRSHLECALLDGLEVRELEVDVAD